MRGTFRLAFPVTWMGQRDSTLGMGKTPCPDPAETHLNLPTRHPQEGYQLKPIQWGTERPTVLLILSRF